MLFFLGISTYSIVEYLDFFSLKPLRLNYMKITDVSHDYHYMCIVRLKYRNKYKFIIVALTSTLRPCVTQCTTAQELKIPPTSAHGTEQPHSVPVINLHLLAA